MPVVTLRFMLFSMGAAVHHRPIDAFDGPRIRKAGRTPGGRDLDRRTRKQEGYQSVASFVCSVFGDAAARRMARVFENGKLQRMTKVWERLRPPE